MQPSTSPNFSDFKADDLAANSTNSESPLSEISFAEVDENITMALRAIAKRLASEGLADRFPAESFAAELAVWVRDEIVTVEGVALTREEFRRRLEALKMQFAGQAVQLRITEAADRLETSVLNRI